MRFTLFGQGEGLRSDAHVEFWATTDGHLVTDASISAREKKVTPGINVKAAQALVPDLMICEEEESPTLSMQKVWNKLWNFSPWLQTVDKDAFFLQVSGEVPPFREVKDVLCTLDEVLAKEQRLRVGFAENPFLARALVEWSRCERVPGAIYRKANRQQLVVSPGLSEMLADPAKAKAGDARDQKHWIHAMPLEAVWTIPEKAREQLIQLGLYRLGELKSVPTEYLRRHFGRESMLWSQLQVTSAGGHIAVNYPPVQRRETWRANIGEEVSVDFLETVIHSLLPSLAVDLERAGAGALRVGIEWETDCGHWAFERVAKRPVYRHESLYAQIAPGLKDFDGNLLNRIEVFVEDVRPLSTVQMSFMIHKGMLVPVDEIEKTDLLKVMYQVNRKFPHGLQKGLHPNFREVRWRAVSEG